MNMKERITLLLKKYQEEDHLVSSDFGKQTFIDDYYALINATSA